jgi:propionyl-CoA carboxylase alpha chain
MFKKILIANRGEIACRVIKTARKMGIKTVAVYSEADKDAMHVTSPTSRSASGRRIEGILPGDGQDHRRLQADRRRSGASGLRLPVRERHLLAPLEEEGIIFIGPKHYSVAAMGDKIASKKLALKAKVNVIPGYNDPSTRPSRR